MTSGMKKVIIIPSVKKAKSDKIFPAYYKDLKKIHEETMADLRAGRLKSYNSVEEMNADLRAEGWL